MVKGLDWEPVFCYVYLLISPNVRFVSFVQCYRLVDRVGILTDLQFCFVKYDERIHSYFSCRNQLISVSQKIYAKAPLNCI